MHSPRTSRRRARGRVRGGGVVDHRNVREPDLLSTCRRTRRAEINRSCFRRMLRPGGNEDARASDARASRGCPSLDAAPEVRDGPLSPASARASSERRVIARWLLGIAANRTAVGARFGSTKRPVACIVEHALERFWPDAVASIGTFWRWRTIARSGSQSLLGSRAVRRVGDRRLLQRPDVFELIFDRHFDAVHGYLLRRAGSGRADDLASATFAVAFERRSTFGRRRAARDRGC